MKKEIFIVLCSVTCLSQVHAMEPNFKIQKQERRTAYKTPYNKQDKETLSQTFSTIIAGTIITSAGCILQEPLVVGLGAGLIIGGTDDISNYYKYQRRYNQKTAQ